MSLTLDFSVCKAQIDAFRHFEPGNTLALAWGRGVGKSWFIRQLMYLLVARHDGKRIGGRQLPGVRIVVLVPTLKQFKRNHGNLLLGELDRSGSWGFLGATINRTDWSVRFPGGSSITVVSAQNSEDNRGIRCDAVFIDEADSIDESIYDFVVAPWLSEPHSLRHVVICGTPMRGRYGLLWKAFHVWPKGDAENQPQPHHYGFHATGYDTTTVSREYMDAVRAKTRPDRFAREWLCSFDAGEGLVYPMFDIEFHVRRPPPVEMFNEYIVGIDYGFNDPTAIVVIGVAGHGRDAICHVVHERYLVNKTASEIADVARDIECSWPGARWYADHSPMTTKTLKDEAGVKIQPAAKGKDSVEEGVAFVSDALWIREDESDNRWSQLYISPECKRTIDEFGRYRRKRDPHNTDRVLDDIDSHSGNDHFMDAIRYALVTHFGGRRGGIRDGR